MKYVVVLAFNAYVGPLDRRLVVADEAYGPVSQLPVWVAAHVLPLYNHAALVPPLVEERKLEHALVAVVVHGLTYAQILLLCIPSIAQGLVVFVPVPVPELCCKSVGEGSGFLVPFLLLDLVGPVLSCLPAGVAGYGAVEVELVFRAGDGKSPALAVIDATSFRLYASDHRGRGELLHQLRVELLKELDVEDLAYNQHCACEQHEVSHIEHHCYVIPVLYAFTRVRHYFSTVAGFSAGLTCEPISSSRFSTPLRFWAAVRS